MDWRVIVNPDIIGDFTAYRWGGANGTGETVHSGAFTTRVDNKNCTLPPGDHSGTNLFTFKASNSNSIYKNSTLQLDALRLLAIIKS